MCGGGLNLICMKKVGVIVWQRVKSQMYEKGRGSCVEEGKPHMYEKSRGNCVEEGYISYV